jgi:hypothetical protein
MMKLHYPATAMAFGLPLNDAIARMEASAKELCAATENVPSRTASFGERLTQAVKRQLPARRVRVAAQEESFSERLAQRVKEKLASRPRITKTAGEAQAQVEHHRRLSQRRN